MERNIIISSHKAPKVVERKHVSYVMWCVLTSLFLSPLHTGEHKRRHATINNSFRSCGHVSGIGTSKTFFASSNSLLFKTSSWTVDSFTSFYTYTSITSSTSLSFHFTLVGILWYMLQPHRVQEAGAKKLLCETWRKWTENKIQVETWRKTSRRSGEGLLRAKFFLSMAIERLEKRKWNK